MEVKEKENLKSEVYEPNPVGQDDEYLGTPIEFSDVKCSNEEQIYFLEQLEVLLTMYGPSREEKLVLDHFEKEIMSCEDFSRLRVLRDDENFGLLVVVPPKNEVNEDTKTILFDAHCDTVRKKYINPKLFLCEFERSSFKQRKKTKEQMERVIVKATGLDNRIHCALLLTMVKFCRYESFQYCALFTVQEENGMHGAQYFSQRINLKQRFQIPGLEIIIVLDVCDGKLRHKAKESSSKSTIIGGGMCPVYQPFTNYGTGIGLSGGKKKVKSELDATNAREFKYNLRNVVKCRYSCPCSRMHYYRSYASVSDAFDLLEFLGEDENVIRILRRETTKWDCEKELLELEKQLDKIRKEIRSLSRDGEEGVRRRKLTEERNAHVEKQTILRQRKNSLEY